MRYPVSLRCLAAASVLSIALCLPARAGVVNDGSLGSAAVVHAGNIFTISPASGKQVGSNLFYSLTSLNLINGQTANFTGPIQVQNVLTRITGGSPTTINGTLECSITGANFFLINPSGVVFGPNAAVNVSGSFAVVTADQIKLADGAIFNAVAGSSDATLSTAAPSAFGFLSASPNPITLEGTTLSGAGVPSITAVAGGVNIIGGAVAPQAGSINIASVASAGNAALTGNPANPLRTTSFSAMGPVNITQSATATGKVFIRGGAIEVDNSTLNFSGDSDLLAQTSLSASQAIIKPVTNATGNLLVSGASLKLVSSNIQSSGGGGLTLAAAGQLNLNNSSANSNPNAGGGIQAAGLSVTADSLRMVHNSQLTSTAETGAQGGNVTVNAGSLTILTGSQIFTTTTSAGAGGSPIVNISGVATLDATNQASGADTGIRSSTSQTGTGGTILVTAGTLNVLNHATITAFTNGPGQAGDTDVNAVAALLTDGSTIQSATIGDGAGGKAKVTVSGDLTIDGSGTGVSDTAIGTFTTSSTTLATASAGGVQVQAASLEVTNGGDILSVSQTPGASGNVHVTAGTLSLSNGGAVEDQTTATGADGNITVAISGAATIGGFTSTATTSGIDTHTSDTAAGALAAGNIRFSAASLSLLSGGNINSDSAGHANTGNLYISTTGAMTLDGTAATSTLSTGFDTKTTLATAGGGADGSLTVSAGSLEILANAGIKAISLGTGATGPLTVNVAGDLTLNGAGSNQTTAIYSSTGKLGTGSSLAVNADNIKIQHDSDINTETDGPFPGGPLSVVARGTLTVNEFAGTGTDGILSTTFQTTPGAGQGGSIAVQAANLSVRNGGEITSITYGPGAGGNVTVDISGATDINGTQTTVNDTEISTQTVFASPGAGNAGNLTLNTGTLSKEQPVFVNSVTFGTGKIGTVSVHRGN